MAAGTLTINVPAGAQRVVIACIAGKTGVTKVINETAMNADVTSTFTQSSVNVEALRLHRRCVQRVGV